MARRARPAAPSPAKAGPGLAVPLAGEFPTQPHGGTTPSRGGFAGSKGKARGTKHKGHKPAFLK